MQSRVPPGEGQVNPLRYAAGRAQRSLGRRSARMRRGSADGVHAEACCPPPPERSPMARRWLPPTPARLAGRCQRTCLWPAPASRR
jgi:hypothetical protein